MQSDAELVNAVLDGQKQGFAVLVRRYARPVRAAALSVTGDYHLAADVSQEAFVKAYEKLAGLRKAEAFGPWLLKITRRCALDCAGRKPKELPLEVAVAAIESPNGEFDERKQALLGAVLELPKAEKQVVMLRYFAGHSVKDVGRIVGRSVGTITKQLSRAHRRLRKIMKEAE